MDLSDLSVLRCAIVDEARRWKGVPFVHQGRSRDGIDCAGLVIKVAHELALSSFDVRVYRARPDGKSMKAVCDRQMIPIALDAFGPGHILLFHNLERAPQHLAIVADYFAGGLSIIHAYERNHKVVEARLDDVWRRFIVAAYALPVVS